MKTLLLLFFFTFSIISFSQSWEPVASLPESASVRHHPITFSIAGIGYLVAGAKPTAGVLKDFYAYDPLDDSWTTLSDFPGTARGFSYAVTTESKGYVGFGLYEDEETLEWTALADLWEFDAGTGEWTELASCPGTPRFHPAMVQVNNKIYVGLGGSEFGDLDDWWEYDIESDTWTEKAGFPSTERHHPYYFGIGEYAYVGFGHHAASIFNDFYRYDPSTDSWTEMASLPEQGRVAGTQFDYAGKGYILSGQGETHSNLPTGEFWEYDPETDDWNELIAHPGGGRWAPGSFEIDGNIYFTCGEANTGEKRDMMVFGLDPAAGINDLIVESAQSFYPNPSHGAVTIIGNETTFTNAEVYDAAGQSVLTASVINNQIDLNSLNPGMYMIQLTDGQNLVTEKLIIE